MEIEITDENGNTRTATVCRIVADRELTTIGPDGEAVMVAEPGDKGGYVECELDESGKPVLPVQPGEDGAPSDRYEGRLKGLSQNDNSWVHEGSILAGEASVRDDAQIQGVDTVITGADAYTENIGVGGECYRSSGMSEFSGGGSYNNMVLEPGAKYEFSGYTQVGGKVLAEGGVEGGIQADAEVPLDGSAAKAGAMAYDGAQAGGMVVFKAGTGRFCDSPDGDNTMIFPDAHTDKLVVETSEGFESNGLVASGNATLKGSFKGCGGMIIQDSEVDTDATFGPVVLLDQKVGREADGMTLDSDEALTAMYGAEQDGEYPFDEEAYRAGMDEVIAHELGKQYQYTNLQHHDAETLIGQLDNNMMDTFRSASADATRGEIDEKDAVSSAFHDGINDARLGTEMAVEAKWGKDGAEAYDQTRAGQREEQTHQDRAAAMAGKDFAMQVSGKADLVHMSDGRGKLNPNARTAAKAQKRGLPSYQGPADGNDGAGKDDAGKDGPDV